MTYTTHKLYTMFTHVHTHAYTHTRTHTRTHTHTCIHVHTHTHVHDMYTHTHIHTHTKHQIVLTCPAVSSISSPTCSPSTLASILYASSNYSKQNLLQLQQRTTAMHNNVIIVFNSTAT